MTINWLVFPKKHVFPSEREDEVVGPLQLDFTSAPDKMDACPTTILLVFSMHGVSYALSLS